MIKYLLFFLSILFATDNLSAKKIEIPKPVKVEALKEGTATRPVELSKIVVKLNRGEPYGTIKGGLLCIGKEPLIWRGGKLQLDPTDFNEVFKNELDKLGFNVSNDSSALFDEGQDNRTEFLGSGPIKGLH